MDETNINYTEHRCINCNFRHSFLIEDGTQVQICAFSFSSLFLEELHDGSKCVLGEKAEERYQKAHDKYTGR